MKTGQTFLNSGSMMGIIERTLDHVDARLSDHGTRVAFQVYRMARALGIQQSTRLRNLCLLAILHDVGAYKIEEIDNMLGFEAGHNGVWNHSAYGYLFLRHFSFLGRFAEVVLYHHADWARLQRLENVEPYIKRAAQIIHLADRADVFHITKGGNMRDFSATLDRQSGTQFDPEVIALFRRTMEQSDQTAEACFYDMLTSEPFTPKEIDSMLRMLVFTIDFRSMHTVTHTITTTVISQELARRAGLSEAACNAIEAGALLHDLGKIAIPVDILENPGRLDAEQMRIMRTHVALTREILGKSLPEEVREIALRHHEKLDGSGYPIGLSEKDLTQEQRIVAVADIVSALHGRRSYKEPFPKDKTIDILLQESQDHKLDASYVQIMIDDYDAILHEVQQKSVPVLEDYAMVQEEYAAVLNDLIQTMQ